MRLYVSIYLLSAQYLVRAGRRNEACAALRQALAECNRINCRETASHIFAALNYARCI